jgi:hypothetical protein
MASLLVAFVAGCGVGDDPVTLSSAKAITAYSLAGVTGTINETAKTIAVPMPFGTNLTALVATFTTTGASVKVGAVTQASGTTANNFTSPVAYIVTAADTTTATYTVTVTVAQNFAKAITAYSLAGVTGTINETAKTIAVTMPFATNPNGLIATFTTTGAGVNVGAVAQTSGTTANDFTNPVVYLVTAADGTTATYTVTVTVALNFAKAITAYSLAGVTGTIDEAAKTISVAMPFGTNPDGLIATFTTTGASVKIGAVVQVSGTTANNFTSPVAYIVTAADTTTVTYTVTVTVALNFAKAITAYSLNGVTGTIDEALKTISVTMPNGTNPDGLIATFTTTGASVTVGAALQTSGTTANDFTNPVAYTVTAADGTTETYTVTVTVVATANPTAPVLGEAGRFVILAAAAITTTGVTAISNGDIGVTPAARSTMAGFTVSPETVSPKGSEGAFTELTNGLSYGPDDANPAPFPFPLKFATPTIGQPWATTGAMLTQAATDLGIADTFLGADPNPTAPTQVCPTQLGLLTLTPGVYKTAADVSITTGTLQLDAQGDANAVWIFVIGGTLTTGAPGGNITFVGGVGQAKNVFWRTAGITTIGAGTSFIGNVFAATKVVVVTGASVTGRLFGITDRVTLDANAVTKAP